MIDQIIEEDIHNKRDWNPLVWFTAILAFVIFILFWVWPRIHQPELINPSPDRIIISTPSGVLK